VRSGHGHTLIELMIAMSLGLLVTCAVLSLYRDQRDGFERAADWASITEAGYAALDQISVQARLAGLAVDADGSGNLPRDSLTAFSRQSPWVMHTVLQAPTQLAEHWPVFGCHAGRPTGPVDAPRCEVDSRASDGVQFLSIGNNVSSWADTEGAATDCLGQALPVDAVSAARFFTRVSRASGEPELYCDGSARLGDAQPIVEGVETLQLRYWLADDEAPLAVVAADQWPQVRALEVCLVVRGQPGPAPFPYLDCGGRSVPGVDRRRRQVFRLFVARRNYTAPTR